MRAFSDPYLHRCRTTRFSWCLVVLFLSIFTLPPHTAIARKNSILHFIPAILAHPVPQPDAGVLYADPHGSGTDCSAGAPCSLTMARNHIHSLNNGQGMATDITVYLRGGTYTLNDTFALTAADSGTNGHVIHYRACPGEKPVISGGTTVTGWSLYDTYQGIYRAWIGTGINFRQLYVNDIRAIRARGMSNPDGFIQNLTGFSSIDPTMQQWGNQQDIEIVGFNQWRSFRCPVATIAGTSLSLQQPCWSNSSGGHQPDSGFDRVTWVENGYELLDEPGEWYFNRNSGYLYYKPKPDEDLTQNTIIYPRLQTLVSLLGTNQTPIKNISFSGITFTYSSWLLPSGPNGYADLQAGFHFTGTDGALEKTAAALQLSHGKNIHFTGNTFIHLGGAGLTVADNSASIRIVGNRFEDISSSGIQLGDIDPNTLTTNLTITDNVLIGMGREYHDGVGIFAGYVKGVKIEHNELRDLPYSGISIGWGWGVDSFAGENIIRANWIENFMHTLRDGGGVYTLSPQPASTISNNFLCRQPHSHGAVYLDEGTSGYLVHDNVLTHNGDAWLFIHNGQGNSVRNNYTDNGYLVNQGFNNTITSTSIIQAGNWPQTAVTIIQNAGVSTGYQGSGMPSFCRPGVQLLFVDDDSDPEKSWSRNGYDGSLFTLDLPYDIWDTGNGNDEPDLTTLNRYQKVIWSTGYADIGAASITGGGESALETWLDTAGDAVLLLSSHLYHAWPVPSSLMINYLGINSVDGYTNTGDITGVGLLDDYGTASLRPPVSRGNNTYTLHPGSAATLLEMNGMAVGTTRSGNGYQATYLAFPPAAVISKEKRTKLLDEILRW